MIVSKNYFVTLINKKQNVVFLLFVLATFIFWFLNRLSNDYIQQVPYQIEYKDLPKRFVFQDKPQEEINVSVEASGFYLFKSAIINRDLKISLKNIKKKDKYSYYLLENELNRQVKEHLKDRIRVLGVTEDSLLVNLGRKVYKKVPLKSHVDIKYNKGYKSFNEILEPDSIEVSGPEMQVSKIDYINLVPFQKENVMESISENIAIVESLFSKIDYSTKNVKLHLEVEKITEKTIEVPVSIINTSSDEVVIYPKKIKVNCQMKLSDFNKITQDDFVMICDYDKRNDGYIEVELLEKPSSVSMVKIEKKRVEYLILK